MGLNETGALVWEHLDESRTIDELVERIAPTVDATAAAVRRDVEAFVEGLRDAGFAVRSDDRGFDDGRPAG